MTEISKKEIEAAREAWREYWCEEDVHRNTRDGMTAALSAAARVRAEANNECGEAAHPAPQPSGMVKALEWVASDDWEYRWIAELYAIEDQGKNWSTDRYWLYYNGQRLGKFGTFDAASSAAQADYERRILSALTAGKPHPDDEAVDRFAAAMKAKLKWEREERGRHGWNDPSICPESYLARLLIEHLAKGNDGNFEDVANFCMMLHQRGAHPRVMADALTAGKPEQSGWRPIETAPKDGTNILGWHEIAGTSQTCFSEGEWVCPDWDEGRYIHCTWSPTHWMPLPTPPTAGGGDE